MNNNGILKFNLRSSIFNDYKSCIKFLLDGQLIKKTLVCEKDSSKMNMKVTDINGCKTLYYKCDECDSKILLFDLIGLNFKMDICELLKKTFIFTGIDHKRNEFFDLEKSEEIEFVLKSKELEFLWNMLSIIVGNIYDENYTKLGGDDIKVQVVDAPFFK